MVGKDCRSEAGKRQDDWHDALVALVDLAATGDRAEADKMALALARKVAGTDGANDALPSAKVAEWINPILAETEGDTMTRVAAVLEFLGDSSAPTDYVPSSEYDWGRHLINKSLRAALHFHSGGLKCAMDQSAKIE